MSDSRVPLLAVGALIVGLVMGNSLVSRAGTEQLANVVYIATGANFPDALVIGQAVEPGPILLVQTDSIPESTADELDRLNPKKIVIVGGTAVISAGVETSLAAYTLGPVIRISGGDRFATAAALSADQYPLTGAFVCPGSGFFPMDSSTSGTAWDAFLHQRGGDGKFGCGVHLPDGVTITRVQLAAYDFDNPGNVACNLLRIDVEGGTANSGQGDSDIMAAVDTPQSGIPGYVEETDTTITNSVVDADRFGYWLGCNITGEDTRIVGMIVNYRH